MRKRQSPARAKGWTQLVECLSGMHKDLGSILNTDQTKGGHRVSSHSLIHIEFKSSLSYLRNCCASHSTFCSQEKHQWINLALDMATTSASWVWSENRSQNLGLRSTVSCTHNKESLNVWFNLSLSHCHTSFKRGCSEATELGHSMGGKKVYLGEFKVAMATSQETGAGGASLLLWKREGGCWV